MPYRYSDLDRKNLEWFTKDTSKQTLLSIKLEEGHIRSLYPSEINFNYPISAIAGRNGSGKTTILAIAACAFHNEPTQLKLPGRKTNYYTFSDFFVQSKEELPPEGLLIWYKILHNNWAKSVRLPDGIGAGMQYRRKPKGGKWNDYFNRCKRNVVYFGIERVVPHSEKSVSKSYRNRFADTKIHGWESKVRSIVGNILGKDYDEFCYKTHSRYRLPLVKCGIDLYSGFNMGAGENALFEIFSIIFTYPPGVLLVIDEIELGLHEEAQQRLINELKKLCCERKIQIICTTHSNNILKSLPPEARFFIESFKNKAVITPGINPSFAAGKLAGENSNELDLFVEDPIAKCLIETAISNNSRTRINIIPIGSSSAVMMQLAARFKNIKEGNCAAILDGDKSKNKNELIKFFIDKLEKKLSIEDKNNAEKWVEQRLSFLPGDDWPESWVLKQVRENDKEELIKCLSLKKHELSLCIEESLRAGKHNEFFVLSKKTNLSNEYLTRLFARSAVMFNQEKFSKIESFIHKHLE